MARSIIFSGHNQHSIISNGALRLAYRRWRAGERKMRDGSDASAAPSSRQHGEITAVSSGRKHRSIISRSALCAWLSICVPALRIMRTRQRSCAARSQRGMVAWCASLREKRGCGAFDRGSSIGHLVRRGGLLTCALSHACTTLLTGGTPTLCLYFSGIFSFYRIARPALASTSSVSPGHRALARRCVSVICMGESRENNRSQRIAPHSFATSPRAFFSLVASQNSACVRQ